MFCFFTEIILIHFVMKLRITKVLYSSGNLSDSHIDHFFKNRVVAKITKRVFFVLTTRLFYGILDEFNSHISQICLYFFNNTRKEIKQFSTKNDYTFCQYFTSNAIKMWYSVPRGIQKYINFYLYFERTRVPTPVPPLSKNVCMEYWTEFFECGECRKGEGDAKDICMFYMKCIFNLEESGKSG